MSLFALGLVLVSAVFHATWNLLAKRAGADTPFLWLAYVVGAIVFAPFAIGIVVIARPQLGWAALVFIAVAVGERVRSRWMRRVARRSAGVLFARPLVGSRWTAVQGPLAQKTPTPLTALAVPPAAQMR